MDAIYRYFYPNYKEWVVINNHAHPLSIIIDNNRYDFYVNQQHIIKFNVNDKVTIVCKKCRLRKKQHLEMVDLPDENDNDPPFIAIDMPALET